MCHLRARAPRSDSFWTLVLHPRHHDISLLEFVTRNTERSAHGAAARASDGSCAEADDAALEAGTSLRTQRAHVAEAARSGRRGTRSDTSPRTQNARLVIRRGVRAGAAAKAARPQATAALEADTSRHARRTRVVVAARGSGQQATATRGVAARSGGTGMGRHAMATQTFLPHAYRRRPSICVVVPPCPRGAATPAAPPSQVGTGSALGRRPSPPEERTHASPDRRPRRCGRHGRAGRASRDARPPHPALTHARDGAEGGLGAQGRSGIVPRNGPAARWRFPYNPPPTRGDRCAVLACTALRRVTRECTRLRRGVCAAAPTITGGRGRFVRWMGVNHSFPHRPG